MTTETRPGQLMTDGRIVARFNTEPAELAAAAAAFMPPVRVGFGKKGLFAAGFAIGILTAFWPGMLPGWPDWLSRFLPGLVLGLFLSTTLWMLLGRRNQRVMATLAREDEPQHATVTCHRDGISWATPEIVHYLSYLAIDRVVCLDEVVLIRFRLFVIYVPARGFASPEDRMFLLDALRQAVPADRLAGMNAQAGNGGR